MKLRSYHTSNWVMRALLLLSILFISGCSRRYLASETKITLVRSGKPVPLETVVQTIYTPDDALLAEQFSVSDVDGIATFKQVYIYSSGSRKKHRFIHYSLLTDNGYKTIGIYYNTGHSRFEDLGVHTNYLGDNLPYFKDKAGDTIRYLEFDLDSLYLMGVE